MNPYLFPSSLFLFFIFIHLPISLSEDNELFIHCRRTFNCGKFSDITYPFYENSYAFYENTRPKECGHPGFELSCHDNTYTIIEINSHKYQVLEIDQTEQILHISLFDFFDLLCPDKYFNTTLNTSLFKFTHDYQNLTLFYGCKPLHEIPSFKSKCLNDGMDSNVYLPAGPTSRDDLLENCSDNVSVPVFESDVNKVLTDPSILGDVLHKGFEVNWIINIRQCQDCVGSDGRCGYNSTTNSFVCFCHDGPCNTTCPASPRKVKLKIGIGVGSGVVGILLTCIVFIICLRRRKRHLSTSTLIPRNISPDPSSKPDLEKGSTYFETPIFSYDELEEATNNFDSTKELGDGGFGTVYKGKLRDGRVVAVKRLYENNCKRVEQFMNEITILSLLRHPNLVSLYGCTSRHSRELLLVYEFIANGTVADHLHGEHTKAGSLTWPIRMNIAIESADALTYLHASDIIHRDVKTTNILLDDNFHVKVADFGLSRLFPTDVTHVSTAPQGTPGYVDPDYHQCYQLTEKSDVYSFGVVLIELISSKQAVDICRHRHEINLANLAINKIQSRALHELVDPFIGFDLDFTIKMKITLVAELAFRCLQQEKEMRPSMREVLEDLRRIKSDEYKTEKVEVDTTADDIGLLKVAPPSPDSVTNKWISNSTTPSTSG